MPSWLSASLISSALMPVSRVGNASRSRSTPRFFFSSRRRHTRCGRYWSSDVCSYDLGASGVTIVALGALLVPALAKAGYNEKFNLGLVTSSGSLGLLFAPSLPLILYGVVVQQMS